MPIEYSLEEKEVTEKQSLLAAKERFLFFRKMINKTFEWDWFPRALCEDLQNFYEDFLAGKRPKMIIQAPPQHGKSAAIVDFISWMMGKHPDFKIIYASFSDRLGIRTNLHLRQIFESERYKAIFPNLSFKTTNQNILEMKNDRGSFRNTTVAGSITGESLDLGILDDPVKGREDAESETIRNKTWDWFTDDFFTRFSDNAALLLIMTRWHVDDVAGRLIERFPDLIVKSYPAIAEKDEPYRKKGEALFPVFKSLSFLYERRKGMPEASWEALYQQHPVIREGNFFRPDELILVDKIPEGYCRFVRGWDLASSTNGDYTVGAKLGRFNDGRYIISDICRFRLGPAERDPKIIETARFDTKATRISLPEDPGQAGKSQVQYLTKQLAGFRVLSSPETGDKTVRAEALVSQVNSGNVLLLRGAFNRDLIEELRLFPNGKHDDQVDALSRAFNTLLTVRPALNVRSFF